MKRADNRPSKMSTPMYVKPKPGSEQGVTPRTGMVDNYVVYSPKHPGSPLKKTSIMRSAAPQPTIKEQFATETTTIQDAARRFLEDVTFNAIVNYYGHGTTAPSNVICEPTIRYKRNPIAQHYCSTTCIRDNLKCPALLCTCSVNKLATTTQKLPEQPSKPTKQVANEGYLKTFVTNLIDKNRLLESVPANAHYTHIPEKYITTTRRKIAAALRDPTAATTDTPMLGRVKIASYGNPKSNSIQPAKGYLVPTNTVSKDQDYFNKILQDHVSNKAGRSRNTKNHVTNSENSNGASINSLFNIPSNTNSKSYNTFIKSTIQKTDIAKTKLAPNPTVKSSPGSKVLPKVMNCTATGEFANNPFMANWCMTNCPFGFCPSNVCLCDKV